jgi:hypothetical protein
MREYNHAFLKNGSENFSGRRRIASTSLNPLAKLIFWRAPFSGLQLPVVGATQSEVN